LEHQQYLGHSLKEIAREKAGIIKPSGIVFSGVEDAAAKGVIEQESQIKEAQLYSLKPAFNWQLKASSLKGQRFDLHTPKTDYTDLQINLLGDFQLRNTALAVGAIELLAEQGLTITESAIREGLISTKWPGRLQFVSQQPYIVLDGAHNPQASRALAGNLPKLLDYNTLILLLGILKDKDVAGILKEWIDIADVFILTKPDSDRAAEPQSLAQYIPPHKHKRVVLKDSVEQALGCAQDLAQATDLICITGSLYTVGEALALLQGYEERRKSNQ
jgi:dihydrofolate synthase/folylpolyglutamate synthase